MEKQTYNGWKNRSTWLAKLHLDNDGKDITDRAIEIAVVANTVRQFKNRAILLLDKTQIHTEQAYDVHEVDFDEIWDSLRIV